MEPAIDPLWGIPLQVRPADARRALRAGAGRAARCSSPRPPTTASAPTSPRIGELAHAGRRAVRHRPGLGPAPALLPRAADRRHDRRRRRRRGQHAQAHQRHHPVVGAHGARRAHQPRATRRHGPHDPEHQPAGAHVREHRRRAAADGRARRGAVAGGHRARELGPAADQRIPACAASATRCCEREGVAEFDPTRLTISACDLGLTGYQLETVLRDDYRIAVEAADPLNIVLNVTFGDSREDLELLAGALRDLSARYAGEAGGAAPPPAPACSPTRRPSRARSSRRATPCSRRPRRGRSAQCAGEVSAEMVTPYPPGIPVLGPGEEISAEIVAYLQEASRDGPQGARPRGPHAAHAARRRLTGATASRAANSAPGAATAPRGVPRVRASSAHTTTRGRDHRAPHPQRLRSRARLAALALAIAGCSASVSTGDSSSPPPATPGRRRPPRPTATRSTASRSPTARGSHRASGSRGRAPAAAPCSTSSSPTRAGPSSRTAT